MQGDDLSKRAKRSLPHLFNFAYGANLGVLVLGRLLPGFEDGTEEGNFVFSVDKYYSRKMVEIVSPADCIAFGDRPGWHTRKGLHNSLLWIYLEGALHGIAPFPSSGHPDYTFVISRRHAGRANMAFLDGHVEHGSLRDWTLPISAVWGRWHHLNRVPEDYKQILNADKWSPLYGRDEHVDF